MSTVCAFCGSGGPFSREHVWPHAIIERLPKRMLSYSAKANKVFRADHVVKDVCAKCNNGELSVLDSYFCSLYDTYFAKPIAIDQPVNFKFDYGLLVKALLKISFNSARTTNVDTDILGQYATTLITPHSTPIGVYLKVSTIHAVTVVGKSNKAKPVSSMGAVRCGPIYISGRDRSGLAARLVQISSFRFYLIALADVSLRKLAIQYIANEPGFPVTHSGETLIMSPGLSALRALTGIEQWPVTKVQHDEIALP